MNAPATPSVIEMWKLSARMLGSDFHETAPTQTDLGFLMIIKERVDLAIREARSLEPLGEGE